MWGSMKFLLHFAMEEKIFLQLTGFLMALMCLPTTLANLSPTGINYEVVALMAIKNELVDPYNVLENWDINSVDPCSWRMVTCSTDGYVSALGIPSQGLSGTLATSIQNLTYLQSVLLQNNAISGPIPAELGKLERLQALDLSNNHFDGVIPSSLGNLKNLNYLKPGGLTTTASLDLVPSHWLTSQGLLSWIYPTII